MNKYIKLFGTMALGLGSLTASAVCAYPGFITVQQADGTELTIRRIGDEFHNMVLTGDGYALAYNAATRNYEYALLENEGFVASGIVAANPEYRSTEAVQLLSGIDIQAMEKRFEADMQAARAEKLSTPGATGNGQQRIVKISDVPTIGKHDVLVVLVQFADKKFSECENMTDAAAYYNRFFHEKDFSDYGSHGSAYDFYRKSSCDKYDPNFRVFGPVTVKGGYADYAGNGGSALTYKMIEEAIPLVDEMYDVNFADFDTDGDGVVDNVYCLYAGYGQADSAVTNSIWPHSYNLTARGAEFDVDGVTINRYTVSQQVNGVTNVPVGIGTFVHEFGHVLGLADHYNNTSQFGNPTNNVGNWDLMSSGSYNNDQNCPAPFSAFERYSLGWTEPVELNPLEPSMLEMTPYMDSGQCYRLTVKPNDKEYFLIENRQQKDWDEYLPGHGILVWHIEEDQILWDKNHPNGDQQHQCVDIVEAGNFMTSTGHASDTFPGLMDVRNYTFQDWSGNNHFGFEWVDEDEDGVCRFLLTYTDYLLDSPEITLENLMGTSVDLSWGGCDIANNYEISLREGEEEILYHAAEESGNLTVTDLKPNTKYTVSGQAFRNTLKSEIVEQTFTTPERQIEEYEPQAMPAREITDNSFLARWVDMELATDYTIQLYGRSHTGHGELFHGFDNFSNSNPRLPEGWEVTPGQGRNEDAFCTAAPSIRLRDDEAYLLVSAPGEKTDSISFWFSPSKAGLILTAEKQVNGEWEKVWEHIADRNREMTQTIDTEGADFVRLSVWHEEDVTGGYVLIDDVTVYYIHDEFAEIRTINVGPSYDDKFNTDDRINSFLIDGLEAGESYGYRVRGEADGRFTPWSEVMKVEEGMEDPEIKEYDDPEKPKEDPNEGVEFIRDDFARETMIFNLQGLRVRGDINSLPSGIYVINGRKVRI